MISRPFVWLFVRIVDHVAGSSKHESVEVVLQREGAVQICALCATVAAFVGPAGLFGMTALFPDSLAFRLQVIALCAALQLIGAMGYFWVKYVVVEMGYVRDRVSILDECLVIVLGGILLALYLLVESLGAQISGSI